MSGSMAMFDWLLLAMAAYVLYSGIVGKGKLYSVENIKEGKEEEFKQFSRKIYIYLGITMIINSGATILSNMFYEQKIVTPATDTTAAVYGTVAIKDLGVFSFLTDKVFTAISITALVLTLGLIVFLVVKMRKYMDKNAQAKKAEGAKPAGGSSMPSSAFNFDDDDKSAK